MSSLLNGTARGPRAISRWRMLVAWSVAARPVFGAAAEGSRGSSEGGFETSDDPGGSLTGDGPARLELLELLLELGP